MTPLEPSLGSVLIFDIETNGLLAEMDRAHVLVIKDSATRLSYVFSQGPKAHGSIEEGVRLLLHHNQRGGLIAGHNVINFDTPALHKLFPWFVPNMDFVRDTLVMTRLIFTDLIDLDTKLMKAEKLPKKLFKRHSLEAWGYRLGVFKDEYRGDPDIADEKERKARKWERWNQSMEDYCIQDVEATEALWIKCMSKVEGPQFVPLKKVADGFSIQSIELEHQVASIVARQERHGICFDTAKAAKLYSLLVGEKLKIEEELKRVFKPRYFRDGPVLVPKQDNKKSGYTKDVPLQKIKLVEFNPGSRMHIAIWLKALHGWEPDEYTAGGAPKVDETVLSQLPYKEAEVFKKYLVITKRLGQLAEGNEAWLRHEKNGRIHGRVITNGAVTGRMTHSNPNLAQVPAGYSLWGHECRELFHVPRGKTQVGADAEALELRDLAGYMARYDGGAYVKTVLEGDKKAGTDIHSVNAKALGLDPKKEYFDGETGRDIAKTWFLCIRKGTCRSNPVKTNCVNSVNLQNGQH